MKTLILAIVFLLLASSFPAAASAAPSAELRLVSEAQWDNIAYQDGMFAVQQAGQWGFINEHGRVIAPPRWDEVGPFYNGLARVVTADAGLLAQGMAAPSFINKTGRVVLTLPAGSVESLPYQNYKNGVIPAGDGSPDTGAYYRRDGTVATDKNLIFSPVGEGLAVCPVFDGYNDYTEFPDPQNPPESTGVGYMDMTGAVVIPGPYENAQPFDQGLAPVRQDGQWGFIDKTGQWVIAPLYDDFSIDENHYTHRVFNDGLAAASQDGKFGVIDMKGKVVADFIYDAVEPYHNGYAAVFTAVAPGEWTHAGFLDAHGDLVPAREDVDAYMTVRSADGLVGVQVGEQYGYLNLKTNEITIAAQYQDITPFSEKGMALVKLDGRYRIIDREGNYLSEEAYEWESAYLSSAPGEGEFLIFCVNGKWGIMEVDAA